MFQKILDIISSIIRYLYERKKSENIRNSKTIEDAKKEIQKKDKELDKQVSKMNEAIAAHDDKGDAKINAFLGKILGISAIVLLAGCISSTNVYVSETEEVKSITYLGVKGKFVPDATFSKMIKKLIEYENLVLEVKAKESLNK